MTPIPLEYNAMSLVQNHHEVALLGQEDGQVNVHLESLHQIPFSTSQLAFGLQE
jgi:hypothetical protein